MLDGYLTARGVRGASEITLVIPLSSPVPASADLSRALVGAFADRGITLLLGRSVKALEPGRKIAVLDDGTELHFGVEYFFATNTPFALRAGWWRDPAHQIRYEGPIDTADGIVASILYPGDEDEDHYSIGIGWAWPDFQLDAAWDHADSSDVVSLSIVARFR